METTLNHPDTSVDSNGRVYPLEAYRRILGRQPEWKVRAALEEGNIPSSHRQDTLAWLAERSEASRLRQRDR